MQHLQKEGIFLWGSIWMNGLLEAGKLTSLASSLICLVLTQTAPSLSQKPVPRLR